MSFKIPKELEPLGLTPIEGIDDVKEGDLLIVPDAKTAPKLRVTIETLRSWGLSVTSYGSSQRWGCDCFSAARRVFGSPERMSCTLPEDMHSHVLVFNGVSYDKNSVFGKKVESRITYENANSIHDSKEIVEPPSFPFMSARLSPVDPLYPTRKSNEDLRNRNLNYPQTLTVNGDARAYDILIDAVGKKSLPTISAFDSIMHTSGYANLPYFMSIVSGICVNDSNERYNNLLSEEGISEIFTCFGGSDGPEAASLIMTAPIKAPLHTNINQAQVERYFHHNTGEAQTQSLNVNRKFLMNIVKRGALLYRSEKLFEMSSVIMASCVAKEMSKRYSVLLKKIKNLAEGLSKELPKLEEIKSNYDKAAEKLTVSNGRKKAIVKFF